MQKLVTSTNSNGRSLTDRYNVTPTAYNTTDLDLAWRATSSSSGLYLFVVTGQWSLHWTILTARSLHWTIVAISLDATVYFGAHSTTGGARGDYITETHHWSMEETANWRNRMEWTEWLLLLLLTIAEPCAKGMVRSNVVEL